MAEKMYDRAANPLFCAFVDAAQVIGFTMNKDFNGAEQEGFGFYQVTWHGLETG